MVKKLLSKRTVEKKEASSLRRQNNSPLLN